MLLKDMLSANLIHFYTDAELKCGIVKELNSEENEVFSES